MKCRFCKRFITSVLVGFFMVSAFGDTAEASPSKTKLSPGWHTVGKAKVYHDENGDAVSGFREIDGYTYYFIPASGVAATDLVLLNGKFYYFDKQGHMATGWTWVESEMYIKIDNDPNAFQRVEPDITLGMYYFDPDGSAATGWREYGDGFRYVKDGVMLKDWIQVDGKTYYLDYDADYTRATGWKKIGVFKYYFGDNGVMRKGWQKISGKWYYFDSDGRMVVGERKIGSKYYKFKKSGVCKSKKGKKKASHKHQWIFKKANISNQYEYMVPELDASLIVMQIEDGTCVNGWTNDQITEYEEYFDAWNEQQHMYFSYGTWGCLKIKGTHNEICTPDKDNLYFCRKCGVLKYKKNK